MWKTLEVHVDITVEEHSGNQSVSNYVSKCNEQIS